MTVIMVAEVPGADASLMEQMRAAGLLEALAQAPGFVSHVSGAFAGGYRVIEVWETRDAHQSWYDNHIAQNLPPGVGPVPSEYADLVATVPSTT